MDDPSVYDPSREETERAADVLADVMNQPRDGYWMSVAEDQLRAAARVRLVAKVRRNGSADSQGRVCWPLGRPSVAEVDAFDAALGEGRR